MRRGERVIRSKCVLSGVWQFGWKLTCTNRPKTTRNGIISLDVIYFGWSSVIINVMNWSTLLSVTAVSERVSFFAFCPTTNSNGHSCPPHGNPHWNFCGAPTNHWYIDLWTCVPYLSQCDQNIDSPELSDRAWKSWHDRQPTLRVFHHHKVGNVTRTRALLGVISIGSSSQGTWRCHPSPRFCIWLLRVWLSWVWKSLGRNSRLPDFSPSNCLVRSEMSRLRHGTRSM